MSREKELSTLKELKETVDKLCDTLQNLRDQGIVVHLIFDRIHFPNHCALTSTGVEHAQRTTSILITASKEFNESEYGG